MSVIRPSVIFARCLVVLLAASAAGAAPTYVGTRKCKTCHLKEYRSWEKTQMARAFDLLRPGVAPESKKRAQLDPKKDYTHETKCLPCHTTGYGKPGGFVSAERTPDLAGVQCEECHGPGSEYLQEGEMTLKNLNYRQADLVKVGLVLPSQATCAAVCHNDRSPFRGPGYHFKYDEREAKGSHELLALKHKH